MKTEIVLTGILKCKNKFLAVKRTLDDDMFPGAWEFPGGHLEEGETLKEGLKRELREEIGFDSDFDARIVGYDDKVKKDTLHIEFNFLIEVNKKDIKVKLSNEHIDYKWLKKDSELLDEYIKSKIEDIK